MRRGKKILAVFILFILELIAVVCLRPLLLGCTTKTNKGNELTHNIRIGLLWMKK